MAVSGKCRCCEVRRIFLCRDVFISVVLSHTTKAMWLANVVCVGMIQLWATAGVMSLGKIWWALAVSNQRSNLRGWGPSSAFFGVLILNITLF
jgi:hypothetical protein